MHSIERYGIVALLFLVVTVVAVLMWDGGKNKKKESLAATRPPAAAKSAALEADRTATAEDAAGRRLSLVAESQPGPLLRQSRARQGAAGAEGALQTPAGEALPEAEASEPAPLQDHVPPAAERADTGREEPARDPIVGRAPAAATHSYAVRSGDTLSEIAQRELGSSRRWPEIVAANPGLDPARLRAGKTILIPGAAPAAGSAPRTAAASAQTPTAAPKTWKVAKGENLWKIAERALGDGKRWPEIAALNPRANPDRLVLGQVLTLPGASSPAKKSGGSTAKKAPLVASAQADRPASRGGKVR